MSENISVVSASSSRANRIMLTWLLRYSLAALLLSLGVNAEQPLSGVSWVDLTAQQQQTFTVLQSVWSELPTLKRQHLLRHQHKWQDMPLERQLKISRRLTHWVSLSDEEQKELHARHKHYRSLPEDERHRIHDAKHSFANLNAEDRKRLKDCYRMYKRKREGVGDAGVLEHDQLIKCREQRRTIMAPYHPMPKVDIQ